MRPNCIYIVSVLFHIMKWYLNETEIRILHFLINTETNVNLSTISIDLELSPSWASDCVSNLNKMGFVEIKSRGKTSFVDISQNKLGEATKKLVLEEKQLNLFRTIGGSSLKILPYIIKENKNIKDISKLTSLTYRTVFEYMKRWNQMGVAYKDKNRNCTLNPRMNTLKEFIIEFIHFRNQFILRSIEPKAVLIWERWEEFLFSHDSFCPGEFIHNAGITRLTEIGVDIISNRNYMFYSKRIEEISAEEALVQTILIDPLNPRPRKVLKEIILNEKIEFSKIKYYSRKYGIKDIIIHEVRKFAGEEVFQEQ